MGRTKLKIRSGLLFLLTTLLAIASAAQENPPALEEVPGNLRRASFDPQAPWCGEGMRLAPDGAIVHMGKFYFRLCMPPIDPYGQRLNVVGVSSDRIPDLTYDRAVYGTMLDERRSFEFGIAQALGGKAPSGRVTFGDVAYDSYYSDVIDIDGNYGPATYVYVADTDPEHRLLPYHMIECNGRVDTNYREMENCYLNVWSDGIWASTLFMAGPNWPPLPIEKFPEFALDTMRVLKEIDVTDERDGLAKALPVFE